MKFILVALMTLSASASIINSTFEARHNDKIIDAIINNCNVMKDLTLVSTKKVKVVIDQGIVDYKFISTFTGKQRYDQNMFDHYEITIESWLYDGYDQETKKANWYNVESVKCEMTAEMQ
ncbi:hypothetical protein M902_0905 [Bacteriovorax sp. BAL6_X]|uniref:hypothetical protein n=1 Tax=Bacteriovorax sp. BAL6_X TaxID=1201290 RepID=UPI000385A2E4|nr:hypothetical protein [Bacteriovorax sp. BAL6_X]EPZ49455.1 hypothetical protein M902_0905 [Bacteriovorax sp. BAL6_X]